MPVKVKKGVNKSKEIREYNAKHPDKKPSEIMEAMKKVGVEVSPAFVSTILSTQKKKEENSHSVSVDPDSDIALLIDAEKFSNKVGGIEKAEVAIELLKKFRSK